MSYWRVLRFLGDQIASVSGGRSTPKDATTYEQGYRNGYLDALEEVREAVDDMAWEEGEG